MNARAHEFEITLEGCQIEEAVASVLHTILLHRTIGKFHYKAEGNYSIGTIGTEDIDCDFIDLTYVRVHSDSLNRALRSDILGFRDSLRQPNGQHGNGQIDMQFYQKHRRQWPFGEDSIPWEIWSLKVDVIHVATESEHQRLRESVGDSISEILVSICSTINQQQYVPKMPVQSELGCVFETRVVDVQPYLFKIAYQTTGSGNIGSPGASVSSTVKRLIRDTLSL